MFGGWGEVEVDVGEGQTGQAPYVLLVVRGGWMIMPPCPTGIPPSPIVPARQGSQARTSSDWSGHASPPEGPKTPKPWLDGHPWLAAPQGLQERDPRAYQVYLGGLTGDGNAEGGLVEGGR